MYMNGYDQYKSQSINTMTSGELLMLLYDELMKRILRAELALDQENYDLFSQSVDRSREIVRYLDDTLDRQFPISAELSRLYEFFQFELSRAAASRNKEVLQELKPLVEELRGSFRQAEKTGGK
ncbi:MAG: flagellar protein FliS [Butyricicoccus pullicaecorum]|nr:flagellar protein FliS [Butyricicoccus pullicaecorum]MBS5150592.1 flagellar protein FliS [Butyricicoccus pullicaecorum]